MDEKVIIAIVVGFIAQMIDGALGMGYGISATTFLLTTGVPPALVSASVHMAEVFTTGVSGFSHLKLGNVDQRLLKRLLIPGIIGGIIGTYILTTVPTARIKPFVAAYLLIMGMVMIVKTARKSTIQTKKARIIPLGLIGGFLDAVGGGGWGPIVTSTLVSRGNNVRHTIGTVNLAEFFVTLTQATAFLALIGQVQWQVITGLLIGGVIAAPLAAYLCHKLPVRMLTILVGVLVMVLGLRATYKAIMG